MRTFLNFAIILCLFLCVLAGCSPSGKDATDRDLAGEEVLTVWHWMTDREAAFIELAREYAKETGVKVIFESYAPSDIYSQKIRAAAQANALPDIFGILGEKRDFASFIKAGHVANLSPAMSEGADKWKDQFFDNALAVNEFLENNEFGVEPGIYGVPIDTSNIQMLYNKRLFSEIGEDPEDPPRTWEQFIRVGRKFKESGIQGLVSGWGETWMIHCFALNLAFNILGEKKVMETFQGKVPYTDPDWVKVFGLFKEMRDEGVLAQGIVSKINKDAEQLFANEKAAFAFNGSWCVNVYREMNPGLEYGVMFMPVVSSKYPMKIFGGAGSSFLVNERSANKSEAVKFLKWLTSCRQQVFLSRSTNNLPANKESLKEVSSVMAQFAARMNDTTHPNIWKYHEFHRVKEEFDKGIQSIIIGEKTPEEVASSVQMVKERQMRRRSNPVR